MSSKVNLLVSVCYSLLFRKLEGKSKGFLGQAMKNDKFIPWDSLGLRNTMSHICVAENHGLS